MIEYTFWPYICHKSVKNKEKKLKKIKDYTYLFAPMSFRSQVFQRYNLVKPLKDAWFHSEYRSCSVKNKNVSRLGTKKLLVQLRKF
jgi:hypothetical protein